MGGVVAHLRVVEIVRMGGGAEHPGGDRGRHLRAGAEQQRIGAAAVVHGLCDEDADRLSERPAT